MCVYTYIHMCIHTSVFVYVCIHGSKYIHVYSGMCMHIFITIHACNDTRIQVHTYEQNVFMLWHIATFWGRAKRLGGLVQLCESLITEFQWYVHHWNQHGIVFKCGVFCKLVFESFSILNKFIGADEHHAQHCNWLWPPIQAQALIQQDHLPKDLPSENIENLTLLDLPVTHIQNIQEHRLQHTSFPQNIF